MFVGIGTKRAASCHFPLSSISFSGAGFLGCYHLGVAECLLKHRLLLRPGEVAAENEEHRPPVLMGVSAGALVSVALSAGVRPDDGMAVFLEVVRRTRERAGFMDVLWPGFSLIDQVEDLFLNEIQNALSGGKGANFDSDFFLRRTLGGKLLQIGLTDRRKLRYGVGLSPEAYCFVDQYRDVEDAHAASILSSYVPGLTGPLRGSKSARNLTVKRAWEKVREMESLGFVKYGISGECVSCDGVKIGAHEETSNEFNRRDDASQNEDMLGGYFCDGGLVDICPALDDSTLMVCPFNGIFYPNPSVSPLLPAKRDVQGHENDVDTDAVTTSDSAATTRKGDYSLRQNVLSALPETVRISKRLQLGINQENADTFRRMAFTSENSILETRFGDGFNDARRFLDQNNLLKVFSG